MKKKICVFGKNSFIADGLEKYWSGSNIKILSLNYDFEKVKTAIDWADIIINCTGVTRSEEEDDFFKVNFHYNSLLVNIINDFNNKCFVNFSSIHYLDSNIYGYSQRYKEFLNRSVNNSNRSIIVRLPGVYGEKAKPNRFSVVSTFFHNVIKQQQSKIIEPDKILKLIHIKQLAQELKICLDKQKDAKGFIFCPTYSEVSVGDLYIAIQEICNSHPFSNNSLDPSLKLGLADTHKHLLELNL